MAHILSKENIKSFMHESIIASSTENDGKQLLILNIITGDGIIFSEFQVRKGRSGGLMGHCNTLSEAIDIYNRT